MKEDETILQIIPATGWVAAYQDGSDKITDPVVCFALVEVNKNDDTYREVRPMLAEQKLIVFADDASNYLGLEQIGPN
jgi:hypothetical protein